MSELDKYRDFIDLLLEFESTNHRLAEKSIKMGFTLTT
jgi:hypothetical protein